MEEKYARLIFTKTEIFQFGIFIVGCVIMGRGLSIFVENQASIIINNIKEVNRKKGLISPNWKAD